MTFSQQEYPVCCYGQDVTVAVVSLNRCKIYHQFRGSMGGFLRKHVSRSCSERACRPAASRGLAVWSQVLFPTPYDWKTRRLRRSLSGCYKTPGCYSSGPTLATVVLLRCKSDFVLLGTGDIHRKPLNRCCVLANLTR